MGNIASVTFRGDDFGQIVIMAHNRSALSDAEWEADYLAHIRAMKRTGDIDRCGNLVFAEGSGPNARQREAGNEIFGGKNKVYRLKVAVITDSLMVRGAVTAIRWFNPHIDAFSPADWQKALKHLRLQDKHLGALAGALRELHSKIRDVAILNQVVSTLAPTTHPVAR